MIIDFFIYPVSLVMKLWHLLLGHLLGLNDATAWLFSIIGLVITVRSIMAPFTWMAMRSGRIAANMRPEMRVLQHHFATKHGAHVEAEYRRRRKQLHAKYGYRPAAGCVPLFIQIPAFIGLYRTMLHMAKPAEGLDTQQHRSIGALSSQEVSAFLAGRIRDVPMPAYRIMDETQFHHLRTTQEAVGSFILPVLACAISFTVLNLLLALYRSAQTMDYASKISRGMRKFTIATVIIVPLTLFSAGWNGPVPVAVIIYWVCNNLWTLSQNAIMYLALVKRYPLSPAYQQYRSGAKQYASTLKKNRKQYKRSRRKHKLKIILQPAHAKELRQQLRNYDEAVAKQKAAVRAKQREIIALKKAGRADLKQAEKELARQRKQAGGPRHRLKK